MSDQIPSFDLYATLYVTPDAPVEVIIAAHRGLMRTRHPDRRRGAAALEDAKRLNVARDWLADPDRRRRYDSARIVGMRTEGVRPRSARPERAPSSDLALRRTELAAFVERCHSIDVRDLPRVERRCARVARDGGDVAASGAAVLDVSRATGRDVLAIPAAERALEHLANARSGAVGVERMIRWTAAAYGTLDVAPLHAGIVLDAWRTCVDRDDGLREAIARLADGMVARARRRRGNE